MKFMVGIWVRTGEEISGAPVYERYFWIGSYGEGSGKGGFRKDVAEAKRVDRKTADGLADYFGGEILGAPEFMAPLSEIYENGGLRMG